ncbi:DoxX family protein [Paenibacillus pinihumi]|uniref:DoxX family protein n=1 Tax=Paenibacillus pinihumi TaxID=669462 RepID=UPI0004167559|nr:DoxX family protein [Paenibacillus pinihumi]
MNNRMEIGLLLIRVVLGITFAIHGYDKFHSGIDNTAQWFASIGLPQFLTYVVALLELVGGILLTLGLASRIISALYAIIMVFAIFMVKISVGFIGGAEIDLALFAMAILIVLAGSGKFALDRVFFNSSQD